MRLLTTKAWFLTAFHVAVKVLGTFQTTFPGLGSAMKKPVSEGSETGLGWRGQAVVRRGYFFSSGRRGESQPVSSEGKTFLARLVPPCQVGR